MTWTTFANLTTPTLPELDGNFDTLGQWATVPCTVSGTNDLTFTPPISTEGPIVASYVNYQAFRGIAASDNTGTMTARVGSLGFLPVYKDTYAGVQPMASGDIQSGNLIQLTYDNALNGGGGGFHYSTLPAPAPPASPTYHSQVFSANGTFTVPASATSLTAFKITCVGAGGGGGGSNTTSGASGGGGASGSISSGTFVGISGTALTVSVGTGGTAGSTSGGNGGTGGDTTVSYSAGGNTLTCTAKGGSGGLGSTSATGYSGGGVLAGGVGTVSAGGVITVTVIQTSGGEAGRLGFCGAAGGGGYWGVGGSNPYGVGGTTSSGGGVATGYGAGGSGGWDTTGTAVAGGAGTGGYVIIEWVL